MKAQKNLPSISSNNKSRNLQRIAFIGTGIIEDAILFSLVQNNNIKKYNFIFRAFRFVINAFTFLLIGIYILFCLPGIIIRKFKMLLSPDEVTLEKQFYLFEK
jgi:hypothetical protein